jgi:hypothetical protein
MQEVKILTCTTFQTSKNDNVSSLFWQMNWEFLVSNLGKIKVFLALEMLPFIGTAYIRGKKSLLWSRRRGSRYHGCKILETPPPHLYSSHSLGWSQEYMYCACETLPGN